MTAPTLRPVHVTDACRAELAAIPALTAAQVCRAYAARLVRMTDAQLAVEAARVEALPGSDFRHLVDEEFEIRQAMGPTVTYTATGGAR